MSAAGGSATSGSEVHRPPRHFRRIASWPGCWTASSHPLALGPVTIRNRVVSTSHQTSLVHDHLPTDDLIAYHRARAAGGAGLIVVEATAVHPTGLLTAHTVGGYLPAIVPVWQRMSAAVQEHGTRLVCQLFHGGREMIASGTRPPAVAPSSIPSARFKTEPRALTRAEIGEMLEGYRQAAAHAAEGGLDGVEVCAGFGYLPTQFLSRHANARTDEYGGSFENRFRFLREVLEAMREGFGPHGTIGCRLTDESTSAVGTDPDDVLAAAAAVGDDGLADYLSVTLGSSPTYRGSTWIVPPSPTARNAVAEFARAVKARTSAPADRHRAGARSGRRRPPDRRGRLRRGRDDPGPDRRSQPDAAGPRRRADHALHRLQPGMHRPLPRRRPDRMHREPLGRIRAHPSAAGTRRPPGHGRRGRRRPGRLRRSRSAAACGHWVVVFERSSDAGGQMRLALAAPGHAEIAEGLLEILGGWLASADVRYGAEASAADILAERPDRIVVATGADQHLPAIGGDGVAVVDAWAALGGRTGRRPRGGERLGRRLDRPRHGRGARRARGAGATRDVGGRVRRGRPPVPAKPLPRTSRRRRHRAPPPPATTVAVRPANGDVRERVLRARSRDRRRRHARGERRPDGRRRPLPRAGGGGRADRAGRRLPGPAVVRGGDPRRHAGRPQARPEQFHRGALVPVHFQPVSTWRGRAAPRSMGSIGVQTASSPQPGQKRGSSG